MSTRELLEALPTWRLRKMLPRASMKAQDLDPVTLLATLLYRARLRDDLVEWAIQALADMGLEPAPHHLLMLDRLAALERGEIRRLMIFAPPGSAKSEYCSKIFPAWYIARHPTAAIIASSHTQSLAESFGRRVRNLIEEFSADLGVRLSEDSQAAGQWRTEQDGVYLAAGVRGKITGRRADLSIIDDPVSGIVDASNPTSRDSLWEWYRNDLYTRLKPEAGVLLVNTRWHMDDLSGRLEEESLAATGDEWEILRLPALAYPDEDDPMGRQPGEPLWPEWESLEALQKKRRAIGERAWAALFQQRPRPDSGTLFDTTKFIMIPESDIPSGVRFKRGYDLAATEQVGSRNPDWTACVKMGRTDNAMTLIAHADRMRGRPEQVDEFILGHASDDGRHVEIGLPQDPGAAGKSQIAYFTRMLFGYKVVASPESGDKATRAAGLSSQVNNGQCLLVKGPWNKAYLEELSGFPAASKDDWVDASSRAFNMLVLPAVRRSRFQSVPGLYAR